MYYTGWFHWFLTRGGFLSWNPLADWSLMLRIAHRLSYHQHVFVNSQCFRMRPVVKWSKVKTNNPLTCTGLAFNTVFNYRVGLPTQKLDALNDMGAILVFHVNDWWWDARGQKQFLQMSIIRVLWTHQTAKEKRGPDFRMSQNFYFERSEVGVWQGSIQSL